MLVLSRRAGESLRIGVRVRITLLSVAGGQVRLGIEAPPRIPVHREEVWQRVADANRDAAEAGEEAERILGISVPGAEGEER